MLVATVWSLGTGQLKRPEIEEWTHDSKTLVDSEAFPLYRLSLSVKGGANGKQVMRE